MTNLMTWRQGLCAALAVGLAGCMTVQGVDLGKLTSIGQKVVQGNEINEQQEQDLGLQMTSVILGASPLSPDKQLQLYVNQVGRWLSLQTNRPDLPWTFGVIESKDLNAFAMPGGNVLLTTGLIRNLHSEAELAAVLAHEIGHVVEKHHVKEMERQGQVNLLTDVASFAADTYQNTRKDGGSSDYYAKKMVTGKLLDFTQNLYSKGLSRDDELAADAFALSLLVKAGYDPFALAQSLQTLASIDPNDSHLALLFATHPKPSERLQALQPQFAKWEQRPVTGQVGEQRFMAVIYR